jgi:hypothetical protein
MQDATNNSSLLPSATGLLFSLSNPLNITLLSSQLLTSPAIWDNVRKLEDCRRVFSLFFTATRQLLSPHNTTAPAPRSCLSPEEWITAVVKGADDSSPRWRHLLLLGGVLLGVGQPEQGEISHHLRLKLENAIVHATNLAHHDIQRESNMASLCIVFVLNHTFELLADQRRSQLNWNTLTPELIDITFFSEEGLEAGYWLKVIDSDVSSSVNGKLTWPSKSMSFEKLQEIQSRPLISAAGPLSRLIAHAIEHVNPEYVLRAVDRLVEFTSLTNISWKANKLSGVEISQERAVFEPEVLSTTYPLLWNVLRMSLYATIIILRAVLGRLIHDSALSSVGSGPEFACQSLYALRNLYFIASRLGQTSSSQYMFVHLAAIDIIAQDRRIAEAFLEAVRPRQMGQIPDDPQERCLDLFFLNTAEHFAIAVSPEFNDEVLITAAMPYLTSARGGQLLQMFEAGHSLYLTVLAAPQNGDLCEKHLPFYVEALLQSFPANLSARQFRLAFKNIVRVTGPPSKISQTQPLLQSMLCDIVSDRALHSSTTLLPPSAEEDTGPALSEQAALIMALIDSLCFLAPERLGEWLPLTAELINRVQNSAMRKLCRERFWEALSSGEMDVERSARAVAWWNTNGGRDLLLFGDAPSTEDAPMMNGALQHDSKL